MSTLHPGDSIDHYRVEAFIGAGSMGDVYKGVDASLGRPVALKILSERHRENRELRKRFEREARAVAAISHPNVVQVFTTGSYDDRPYLAMEFLDGIDLATSIDRVGAWPPLAIARAIRDAARGLEAATTQAGLIHRDVKPSNLVRLSNGVVKVTDFGLAKPIEPDGGPQLTAMGVVVGTPDYIAPEQARGDTIDGRVDVYALGGTLFFMLTGRPPYRTGNPAEDQYLKVVQRHLKRPVPNPHEVNPKADPDLSQLAMEMMAKDREQRPTFAVVASRLDRIIAELEALGARAELPAGARGAGRRPLEPTPYLGGREDPAVQDASAVGARVESAPGLGSASLPLTRPALPRPLIALTAACALVFALGLTLVLCGPLPQPSGSAARGIDAGAPTTTDAAPPPLPTPPEGMLAVRGPDGAPFFIAIAPVTADELALALGRQRPSKRLRDQPATKVTFRDAEAYAASRGMRLPTSAEWEAATRAPGFAFAQGLWEWVSDVALSPQRREVRAAPRQSSNRSLGAHADVTFRLVAAPAAPGAGPSGHADRGANR
jgi:serine/threonine-protein kinase